MEAEVSRSRPINVSSLVPLPWSPVVTAATGRRGVSGLPPREGRALHMGFFIGKASGFRFSLHLF
ncbi:uncharacterized protein G2W53_027347 [Senna tora]|uniref:Uncharacterized protein n=1 Tax=Senna tora TaxID=362788 RepID=A0A834TGQ4_9FABA|nr:uncharacterized protein G2W53_027347 [Senna tora]